jgi:hypothetical protein
MQDKIPEIDPEAKAMAEAEYRKVLTKLWGSMAELIQVNNPHNHASYAVVLIAGYSRIAAAVATDLGLSEEVFLRICAENYRESSSHSPKWAN